MTIKRFGQLFLAFAMASVVMLLITRWESSGNWFVTWLLALVIGFIVLCIPLVIWSRAAKSKAEEEAQMQGKPRKSKSRY